MAIGLQAVFDDAGFQQGINRYISGIHKAENATTQGAATLNKSSTALTGVASAAGGTGNSLLALAGIAGGVTLAFGALVSIANLLKGGFDSLLQWSNQIDELQDILGVTTEEAAKMALSMKHVGISVEEGTSAFAFFARQVASTDRQIQQSTQAMTAAQQDAAEQQGDVWSELAKRREQIQNDLAQKITSIESALESNLADMARNNSKQLESLAKDALKIDTDAARDIAKLEADTAKSIAQIDADLQKSLRQGGNARQRRELKAEAAERKKEILAAAAERKAEIEQQRAERQQELAERRALIVEEFNYRKAQAEEAAAQQIAVARQTAQEQIIAANEAAEKQSETINKALEKSLASIRAQLANDPFMQAVKNLNIQLYDTEGNLRPVTELLSDARDTISAMPDGVEKTNAIMQLLGRGGKTFLDWMSLTNAEVDSIYEKNKDAYLLSQDQQNQLQELQRQWNDINIAVSGIALELAQTILPGVIQLTDYIVTNLVPAMHDIGTTLANARETIDQLIFLGQHPNETIDAMGLDGLMRFLDILGGNYAGAIMRRHSGGNVPASGLYNLQAGEFVLNRQQAMQFAPALAGANNSRTMNFYNTWSPSISNVDRASLDRGMRDIVHEEITNVLGV